MRGEKQKISILVSRMGIQDWEWANTNELNHLLSELVSSWGGGSITINQIRICSDMEIFNCQQIIT